MLENGVSDTIMHVTLNIVNGVELMLYSDHASSYALKPILKS